MSGRSHTERLLLTCAAFVLICGDVAWGQKQGAPINTTCPVMTGEAVDPAITAVYKGKTIAFCCDRCLGKFTSNPEKYVGNIPGWAAMQAAAGAAQNADKGSSANSADAAPIGDSAGKEVAGDESAGDRMPIFGRIHPLLVHFPIAALPLALLGFVFRLAASGRSWARADVLPLLVAGVGSVAAFWTGDIAKDASRFGASMAAIADRHEMVSTMVMVLTLVLVVVRIWRWNRLTGTWQFAYALGLMMACIMVGITGYLGGSLVFGPDHLSL